MLTRPHTIFRSISWFAAHVLLFASSVCACLCFPPSVCMPFMWTQTLFASLLCLRAFVCLCSLLHSQFSAALPSHCSLKHQPKATDVASSSMCRSSLVLRVLCMSTPPRVGACCLMEAPTLVSFFSLPHIFPLFLSLQSEALH